MKPALTEAEWERAGYKFRFVHDMTYERRHALAAVALWEQEFGFTREDVTLLRELAVFDNMSARREAASLADRIEALLPPE